MKSYTAVFYVGMILTDFRIIYLKKRQSGNPTVLIMSLFTTSVKITVDFFLLKCYPYN